jgi:hypothetical protein
LRALLAWTFEIFESFAILSINSPLFMCVLPPSKFDYLSCHFCIGRCGLYRTVYAVSSECLGLRTAETHG